MFLSQEHIVSQQDSDQFQDRVYGLLPIVPDSDPELAEIIESNMPWYKDTFERYGLLNAIQTAQVDFDESDLHIGLFFDDNINLKQLLTLSDFPQPPEHLTIDAFTLEPFRDLRTNDGFVISAAGPNMVHEIKWDPPDLYEIRRLDDRFWSWPKWN